MTDWADELADTSAMSHTARAAYLRKHCVPISQLKKMVARCVRNRAILQDPTMKDANEMSIILLMSLIHREFQDD